MRIAVLSDLHGNPYACRAVIDSLLVEGPFEAIVVAGDLCLGGSNPALCLDMLGEIGALAVYGNTEAYLCNPEQIPPMTFTASDGMCSYPPSIGPTPN